MPHYEIDAKSYLSRARTLLLQQRQESLFYAAFELRCCIEARQREYTEAQGTYIKSKNIRPWKLTDTHRQLERVFKSKKIALISLYFDPVLDIHYDCYYTPVPTDLVRLAEGRLHEFLHAMKYFRPKEDVWWNDARDILIDIYRKSWVACRGNMLAPPLLNNQKSSMKTTLFLDGEGDDLIIPFLQEGQRFTLHVTYMDTPPADWKPDL